jgi:hypothetical protein
MDAIDNIIFATLQSKLQDGTRITSDYIKMDPLNAFLPGTQPVIGQFNKTFNYSVPDKITYTSFPDPSIIDKAIFRHWYDVDAGATYVSPTTTGPVTVSDFSKSSTYHLIYAYLIENTRIIQIFERLIERYFEDEDFGIAENFPQAFQWMLNTERLFFKSDTSPQNIRSLIRSSAQVIRRNAYYRMFGVTLAFGDINSVEVPFQKAKASNQQFVVMLERFLAEIWQGFINARNTSGLNTTDVNNIVELATQLQEILEARRGKHANAYSNRNLSLEEFYSVILTTWFGFIISDNSSPIVQFMNCESSTMGERLLKIGNKVGIPAHTKSQALFEMAGPLANILVAVETSSLLNDSAFVKDMLSSLDPAKSPSQASDFMNGFLTVINNWEKATNHRVKNPEASLSGTVRVEQKQQKAAPVMN